MNTNPPIPPLSRPLLPRSYASLEAYTASQITSFGPSAKRMLTRFEKKRRELGTLADTEVEPEWTVVDRVVDVKAAPKGVVAQASAPTGGQERNHDPVAHEKEVKRMIEQSEVRFLRIPPPPPPLIQVTSFSYTTSTYR